jgi:acyl-CoA synthetase (AMP-forming)/AMP-acid ligase II
MFKFLYLYSITKNNEPVHIRGELIKQEYRQFRNTVMDFFENDLQFTKIIFRDRFYYPPEINASIHDLISYFRANIVSNTPFIYLFAPNHIKTIIAYFAIIKSCHVCVLVEPDIGRLELAEMKQDTPPCALVHIDRVTDTFDYGKEIVFTHDNPQEYDWDELSDVATIVYTNAEDGYAKGAMLTRKNLLANAEGGKISDCITERNIFCSLLPFHHMFGLQTGILTPLFSGSSVIIEDISKITKISSFADSISRYKATNVYSVPVIYHLLTKVPGIKDVFTHVEKPCSGACALPRMVLDSFQNKTGKEIAEGYGLTEASPVCTWHRIGEDVKTGSVGRAYPCCDIAIFDENSKERPFEQIGEVYIKGANIMKGYYNNNIATHLAFKNSWLYSGDLGYLDKNGYLYLTGLKKIMINTGGKKVYPAQIKRLLKKHENVESVEVKKKSHFLFNDVLNIHVSLKISDAIDKNIFLEWYSSNIGFSIKSKLFFSD